MLTNEQIKDTGLEIWQLNDIETWIGHGKEAIIEGAMEQCGLSREELCEDGPYKIPVEEWDKLTVTEVDAPYQPRYTFRNYLERVLNESPNQDFPFCFAGYEC